MSAGSPATAAGSGARPRRGWWLAAALVVAAWWIGVTARIAPPPQVGRATTVYVLKDELHRGLVLPCAGGFVEFGFGDWEWYALGRDAWYRVVPTVLWPTPGALSRREFAVEDGAALRAALPWAEWAPIAVDAGRVEALRQRLQAQFDRGLPFVVHRTDLAMRFVPWERSYWFGDTCADALVDWLRELGCTATWVPITCDVAVVAPTRG